MLFFIVFGYRHSESMVEKLRSAGLGFYVRETETQQKLGKERLALSPTVITDVSDRQDTPARTGISSDRSSSQHEASGV